MTLLFETEQKCLLCWFYVVVPTLEGEVHGGKTIGYIYLGPNPIGIFSLSDTCRSGVQEAIRKLKLLGIKTAMLTGDCQSAALQAHEQVYNVI